MKTIYLHLPVYSFNKKFNRAKGISFKIEYEPGSGMFRVAHTLCGRNEKQFSKKLARQALASKPFDMVLLKDLPKYLQDISGKVNKHNGPLISSFAAVKYCWRFV